MKFDMGTLCLDNHQRSLAGDWSLDSTCPGSAEPNSRLARVSAGQWLKFCVNTIGCTAPTPNFKFPPILLIFGTTMAKRIKLCEVQSFSTSPNSRQRTTALNADVSKLLHNAELFSAVNFLNYSGSLGTLPAIATDVIVTSSALRLSFRM